MPVAAAEEAAEVVTAAVVVEVAAPAAEVVATAAVDVAAPAEVAAAAPDVLAVEVAAADCPFTKQGKMCVHMSSPRRRCAPYRILDEEDRILSKEQS